MCVENVASSKVRQIRLHLGHELRGSFCCCSCLDQLSTCFQNHNRTRSLYSGVAWFLWCGYLVWWLVGLNKMYLFIVIISSTNKYWKHKSSMLIWVWHIDKMIITHAFTMARWQIVVKKVKTKQRLKQPQKQTPPPPLRSPPPPQKKKKKKKRENNNNKKKEKDNNNNKEQQQ